MICPCCNKYFEMRDYGSVVCPECLGQSEPKSAIEEIAYTVRTGAFRPKVGKFLDLTAKLDTNYELISDTETREFKIYSKCTDEFLYTHKREDIARSFMERWIMLQAELMTEYSISQTTAYAILNKITKRKIAYGGEGKRAPEYDIKCLYISNPELFKDVDKSNDFDNALSTFEEYKTKYGVSEEMWEVEFKRLQVLCGSTDIAEIADYVKTNFL